MMELFDAGLNFLIPLLVLLHLLVAPYSKVEESFNLQATHDILNYGLPTRDVSENFRSYYDHFSFPGVVPRTLLGALTLAVFSKPVILLVGARYAQLVVRAMLGLFNTCALLRYKNGLVRAFGKDTGRWFILLQASQFHVIFYASRTLPNMFAFGLTTLALREFLPTDQPQELLKPQQRLRRGIFLLVLAGVVFRSEIAILLGTQLLYTLLYSRVALETIISSGLRSASISLLISITIDSYFWQRLLWPELAGFYFNAIQGNSSDWGISPVYYYFTHLLPKLLLNPLIYLVLIPLGLRISTIQYRVKGLIIPSLLYVAIYSLQQHKEARFIIYVVPQLTAAASCSASHLWNRRSKSLLHRLSVLALISSVLCSALASVLLLLISSLNYPGGQAISLLNSIIKETQISEDQKSPQQISIHMDVLSCMSGVTRFLEIPVRNITEGRYPITHDAPIHIRYDKTEDKIQLLRPEWWAQFDYALMETPELALGRWEVIATIKAYSGIEVLRPGQVVRLPNNSDDVFSIINSTLKKDGDKERNGIEIDKRENKNGSAIRKISISGKLNAIQENVRLLTGGWWVGPRLEPRIRVLKRLKDVVTLPIEN